MADQQGKNTLGLISAGMVLALAMGIGRFVFTPILPMMITEIPITPEEGALAASLNYVGYLVGVLIGIPWHQWVVRKSTAITFSCLLVLSLAATGITGEFWWILVMRWVAGVAAAFMFLAAVEAGWRYTRDHPHRAAWIFSGVGIGIILSVVAPLAGSWQNAWFLSAAMCIVMVGCVVALDLPTKTEQQTQRLNAPKITHGSGRGKKRNKSAFAWLVGSYTLEGAAYIIGMTFLVAALQSAGEVVASLAWVLLGAAIIPSIWLWSIPTQKGARPMRVLMVVLFIQAIGLLGLSQPQPFFGVAGALLLGGTFLSVTAISMKVAVDLAGPKGPAIATAGYGVGQILGPIVVAPLLASGYSAAMLLAAGLTMMALVAAMPAQKV